MGTENQQLLSWVGPSLRVLEGEAVLSPEAQGPSSVQTRCVRRLLLVENALVSEASLSPKEQTRSS